MCRVLLLGSSAHIILVEQNDDIIYKSAAVWWSIQGASKLWALGAAAVSNGGG
jgi:hypothetical protein